MEPMETETLQEILDAEKEASRISDEALRLRDGLAERVAHGTDMLKLKYADQVEDAAEAAEQAETARADAEITRLDAETDARLNTLKAGFETSRAGYIDTLFGLVIGAANE